MNSSVYKHGQVYKHGPHGRGSALTMLCTQKRKAVTPNHCASPNQLSGTYFTCSPIFCTAQNTPVCIPYTYTTCSSTHGTSVSALPQISYSYDLSGVALLGGFTGDHSSGVQSKILAVGTDTRSIGKYFSIECSIYKNFLDCLVVLFQKYQS